MADPQPPSERGKQHHALTLRLPRRRKWYERTRWQIVLFVVLLVLFLFGMGWGLNRYIHPQTSTEKKDLVQALGLITAGVAAAGGIYFTWRGQERSQRNTEEQFRLTRQSQEQYQQSTQAQLENAQEELRLTRQGQITERFTRAIDQLGSEKLEIRLGGIYTLERIDKESPERAYHGTVMEVLTAYVRENSHREPKEPSTSTTASNRRRPRLPTDIQAIIDVLNRREEEHVPAKHRARLDLQGAYLFRANLQEAILQEANLQGAFLQEANLQEAILQEAILQDAYLFRANLQEAFLQHAYLLGANLQEAILQGANLQGAFLREANLQGAFLQRANLQRAIGITEDQIEWTIGSDETQLSEDLNRPRLWSKSTQEQRSIVDEHIGGG